MKRLDEAGQGDGVVVQEAVRAKDSGEAVGQSGDSQGMDAGGQRVAPMQVLHDELAVAQLEAGLQRGCKDSMLSFYAPTCDKLSCVIPPLRSEVQRFHALILRTTCDKSYGLCDPLRRAIRVH